MNENYEKMRYFFLFYNMICNCSYFVKNYFSFILFIIIMFYFMFIYYLHIGHYYFYSLHCIKHPIQNLFLQQYDIIF